MFGIRIWGYVLALSYGYFILLAEAQITDPSEVSALLAVKRNLNDPMKHLRNWNKGDPCTSNWKGVVCNDTIWTDGYLHVREIRLLNMNLSGVLAPQLDQLSHLETLDFMWNDLNGSIPKEIGNISSLVLLLLNGNQLSGSFPDELGHLWKLDRLQVDDNNISGPIPKSFANLSSMKHLHLNNNSISGQIPPELSNISTLRHLLVDNNNLSGYLPPELSKLTELRILQLDNNNFNGSAIPASYGNISRLAKLSLRNCSLKGAIPDFSRIGHFCYLDLSQNHLTGHIPLNKLSDNMTTICLSDNHLNGSIPESFSDLPSLQRLSLENNFLTGSVPANIWQNVSFNASDRLTIDLRNNSLSNILGNLNPPENVTLRLGGNPICNNPNTPNIGQFCGSESGEDETSTISKNSKMTCSIYGCPVDYFHEYVPEPPVQCLCESPIRIGYRLKSPSFSYFQPYIHSFQTYVTSSLNLDLYQLSIDSFAWEEGPRLRMYLKLFPTVNPNSSVFNKSEVQRIRFIYSSWKFPPNDFFGPYELLNFTLLGPYSDMNFGTVKPSISKGILAAIILGAIACAVGISTIVTLRIARRQASYQHSLSRKRLSSQISTRIDGVKYFTLKEMALSTNKFDSSTQVGQGGYGIVYKGILSDNTVVAIKRAEEGSLQAQREFLT